MERLVPFHRTNEKLDAKRSVIIRASHRELLSETVLLAVKCWVGACVQEYYRPHTSATRFAVEAEYSLHHYGNEFEHRKMRSDDPGLPWIGGALQLFPPISFGAQRIELSLTGSGTRQKSYPPLKPEIMGYWDKREKTPDLPMPTFQPIVLPRLLSMVAHTEEEKDP